MNFYNQTSRPTDEQYAAIGRVAVHWSLVETALEDILARLAHSPDYLGRALTNDLGLDNRIKALRTLCDVHAIQFGHHFVAPPTIARLRELATEIATKKNRRNKIIHSVWFRQTDDVMFGAKFRTGPAPPDREEATHFQRSHRKLNDFANDLEALADRLRREARALQEQPLP